MLLGAANLLVTHTHTQRHTMLAIGLHFPMPEATVTQAVFFSQTKAEFADLHRERSPSASWRCRTSASP